MPRKKYILQIAVPSPLYQAFDYRAPADIDVSQLVAGVRVKVPWRRGEVVGILINVSHRSSVTSRKLKTAVAVLDEKPLFSSTVFALLVFAASYYHYPIGEVFAAAMPTLLRQGRTAAYRHHYSPFEALPEAIPLLTLSKAQQAAVQTIVEKISQFQAFLLFGVTGSGKTEVYLQVIAAVLAKGKQALVLVPEIGLTPQTVERFQQRFPVTIAVLHSGLTDRERHDAWLQASHGDASIVIGTRSAVFTPLANPGVIIVDEEHDLSFKQQDGFRYSARDLAVVRAQFEKTPVILGSATPSLESFYNAQLQRYHLLSLPERAGSAVRPHFQLIDLRKQPVQDGLSALLIETIQHHLAQNGQVLLFLNRRGYAPTFMCHDCGWIAQCRRCDSHMALHQRPTQLQCHHCGAHRAADLSCPDCGSEKMAALGAGTERLETALEKYFPQVPIIRIDRDTTRAKGALEKQLARIHQGEPSILIGTQMLAKGHHFAEVSLAVIVNADSGLFSTDFRGAERTAQLIVQVAGRAGRVEKPGEVVIQTYHPEHALLRLLLEQGYAAFAALALSERQAASLPPFQPLALIRAEALQMNIAREFLSELKLFLQKATVELTLLGPVPAPMAKRDGKYRAQLLLQSKKRQHLRIALDTMLQCINNTKHKQRVHWSIDIDAQELF